MSTWGTWPEELHLADDQIRRQKSALEKKLTPVSINREAETGIFKGSKGETYEVTLENCTCGDFRRTKKPCKHMYRLAMEVGAFPGLEYTQAGSTSRVFPEEVLERISSLPEEDQVEFARFCYHCGNDNEKGMQYLSTDLAKKLESLGLIKIMEDMSKFSARRKNVYCLIDDSISLDAHKIHKAILRKFPQPEPDPLIFFY